MEDIDQEYLNDNDNDDNENENENENEGENENAIDENDSNSDNRFPEISEGGWITWFCQLSGNEYFVEVNEEFLKHKSNLIGIKCKEYLETFLSPDPPSEATINDEYIEGLALIKEAYGLIHKRFITTSKGLSLMREKYLNGIYGHCQRILCEKQILLPVGLSEDLKFSRVKVYCPRCEEVYKIKKPCNDIDGAYFGTSFPQMFLMHYPDLNPKAKVYKHFIPKLYGFKIFGKKGSKYYTKDQKALKEKMKQLNIKQ